MTNKEANRFIGFEITVEVSELEALKHGINLQGLSQLASEAIRIKVPTAKIQQVGLTEKPKQNNSWIWDTTKKTLICNGREIHLTKMEEVIFDLLAKRHNDYVSYAEMLAIVETEVRGMGAPSHMRVVMHRLRNKLGFDRNLIRTDRQSGYSLRTSDNRLTIR
jgi:DNA-binding response OmpR family regulator